MSKEYYVKAGKSLLTKQGMKGPGDKVTEKMFSSPDVLEALLKSSKNPLTSTKPDVEVKEETKKEEIKDSGAVKK